MNEPKTDSGAAVPCISLLALRIRNLIAAREINTAEANRELSLGGWLSDHRHEDNNLAAEIDALIEKANAPLHLQGGATAEPCKSESDCSQGD